MKTTGKHLAVCGLILQLGLLAGLLGTVLGMIKAFAELGNEILSVENLAACINIALYATTIGYGFAIIGGALLLIALCGAKYRAPWFKKAMWAIACFWICALPLGAIAGIFLMIYLAKHKQEFAQQNETKIP
jgi:Biopolymer transport proteins